MSSRALRRLQKEQELEKQLAAERVAEADEEAGDDEEEVSEPLQPSKAMNAFDMLHDAEEEESEQEGENRSSRTTSQEPTSKLEPSSTSSTGKMKKKKKKSKKKAKENAVETSERPASEAEMDEVDRALRELFAQDAQRGQGVLAGHGPEMVDQTTTTATKLLGINLKHLNPLNEMKSLFGNIALEGTSSPRASPRHQRQREQNQQGGNDLATALTGRHSPASRGKDLGALASRRNVFMQGKEEWPLATSGGLSMERETDPSSSEKKYSIMYSNVYRTTQHEFRVCVEMMDPHNMIDMLIRNPYHIATLLQVSEIAKHQGDHSVSGDLLERALFSFGRSVHSTFSVALRDGSARIAFDKPANRELYLTIWRYVKNLEMRGTWQTAFEWAKILLQFDPRSDPYGVTLMIDQLALRGRKHTALIELCSEDAFGPTWAHLPNIQVSLALAYQRSSQPKLARQSLAVSMHKYPYVLSALASALEISPMPKSLWGKTPGTDAEKLYTDLYATQAKDIWNTPESTSLIAEVAQTLDHYFTIINSAASAPKLEISLEEARHIMLLEIPHLIALLPRRFTHMPTSSSDVLPPPNSLTDGNFTVRAPAEDSGAGGLQALYDVASAAATGGATAFNNAAARVLRFFSSNNDANAEDRAVEREGMYEELGNALGGEYPRHFLEQLVHEVAGVQEDGQGSRHDTARFGMGPAIGDFDYYVEAMNATSDEEDDAESMPELESLPDTDENGGATEQRNPHTATVEEDSDDDEAQLNRPRATLRPILRRVDSEEDSDSEDEGMAETLRRLQFPPGHPEFVPSPSVSPLPSMTATRTDEDDPQRIQRWLLSSGLTTLQSDPTSLDAYVEKLKMLRKQQQGWVINMVKQRAGADTAGKVSEALA